MTKAKHTPGPWVLGYDRGDQVIKSADGETLMCDMTYYPWNPDNPADWALIAAAPDLLEALEGLLDWFTLNEVDEPRLREARAAIAKAKGEVT